MNITSETEFLLPYATATYSPEDNKLRLYPVSRLDKELYDRVKAAGFKWAPKQELFVAPMWTPGREDLLIELVGEVGDEDTSLVDRAAERADRFENYSDHRKADAESARRGVAAIADNIPFGQPILVGHHSERHARRDAEKIESGMRRTIRMWDIAEYWTRRAAGALHHAKYKELPAVRARRIKGLEADKRKQERYLESAEKSLAFWTTPGLTHEKALFFAGHTEHGNLILARKEGDRPDFDQRPSAYDALSNAHPTLYAPRTLDEVIESAKRVYPRQIARYERWIAHYENRLAYERAMQAEGPGIATDTTRPEKGGGCKCWASRRGCWSYIVKVNRVSVTILDNWGNPNDRDGGKNFSRTIPFDKLAKVISKAEVDSARESGRFVETPDKTGFYIADATPAKAEQMIAVPVGVASETEKAVDDMRTTLKTGVQIVVAPQLFPTPPDLAERMIEAAEITSEHSVLEPSAGTGALVVLALPLCGKLNAVEMNSKLSDDLGRRFDLDPRFRVVCADFLEYAERLGTYDRIVMNPPFVNGIDIKHIERARTLLAPGGRLVALCANGPAPARAVNAGSESVVRSRTWKLRSRRNKRERSDDDLPELTLYKATEKLLSQPTNRNDNERR